MVKKRASANSKEGVTWKREIAINQEVKQYCPKCPDRPRGFQLFLKCTGLDNIISAKEGERKVSREDEQSFKSHNYYEVLVREGRKTRLTKLHRLTVHEMPKQKWMTRKVHTAGKSVS